MEYEKSSLSSNYIEDYTYKRWKSMIKVRDEEEDRVLRNDQLRKGPWTPEEDSKLISAIATHGVGRWNSLAFLAGLRRSGKSCRLRWLNYLRPDLRRGTFTLQEQLRVLELHFRWGNRWSKMAEHLPGRTDNEIKNYWRTKVQKLARQFQCQVNSPEFRNALRNIWIPRLIEQIQADTTKAQIQSPTHDFGYGLLFGGYSSSTTSSDNSCMFDTSPTTRALDPLDQHINGPADKQHDVSIDSSSANISTESGSPNELDQNWDKTSDFTLNDEDYMLIWEFLHD